MTAHMKCFQFNKMKLLYLKIINRAFASVKTNNSSSYFVTTPIFYLNGVPHIGHLQSCLYADAFARINRLLGKEVIFSTGTDEHGLKVLQAAETNKLTPIDYCDEMSSTFEKAFKEANISYTHFIRTTNVKHKEMVQDFWCKLDKNGHISKGKYTGWYSVIEEAFVPTAQVKEVREGSQFKTVSIETGSPVERMEEENYVFCLPKFQNDLLYWLSKDVVKPLIFADDLKKWIEEGLTDLSISRPRTRCSWGVPVPNDETQVVYVWLDALVNYLTVGKNAAQSLEWPASCHVIGKDILKFHAIFWPAFLIAAGYEPPREIFCHSHWTVNYEKMSKSKGNVIDPKLLIDKYDVDGFRYFLLRASVPNSDTNYSETKIHRMLNAELCDTLGNLLSRSCAKSLNPQQIFPPFSHEAFCSLKETNIQHIIDSTSKLPETVKKHFLEGYFYKGIDSMLDCLRDTNAFVQHTKPWVLVKQQDTEAQQKLFTILHTVLEVLRICSLLLQPIIPTLTAKVLAKIGVSEMERSWQNIICFPSFHNLPNKLEGQPLNNDNIPLYERRKS
ncbi:methionine--tRNA ligase, mitochondrial-like [Uloborus diversus]|uniref:methionine--tRNA ligase, mitochondrial-like n=1 Tax=Uloborus diversus TaxID=327109 RepID=UPI00240985E2|nr:methionine--tRNA ligase, mitochondrial-like [Uloborus diversus]